MNVYLNKYGVTFVTDPVEHTEYHTFRDFSLLPTKPPCFDPPEPRIKLVTVPGSSTPVDMTEEAAGRPLYQDRKGTMSFMIYADREDWQGIYQSVIDAINGNVIQVSPDEDMGMYYRGRCHVGPLKAANGKATFDIQGQFNPFKRRLYDNEYGANDWPWDPFNFDTDYVPGAFSGLDVDGSLTVNIFNAGLQTPLLITSDAEMILNGFTPIEIGDNYETLIPGDNTLTFTGTGTIDLVWYYRSF